ncbi:hypothetical protein EOD39_9571 [Acipenser ruthenus]|uniref:Uncharacterized protein n=1 Tax=Acipenser ruthenus TaxID=7906 RepID=A0A662YWY5_ACIRT|nr:hypothetical protein EOD39_9571 [Acipenser ruthenus]
MKVMICQVLFRLFGDPLVDTGIAEFRTGLK